MDKEDYLNCRAMYNDLRSKYPPSNTAENNGLVLLSLMIGSKCGMWDVFPFKQYSYNAPYFGGD